MTCEELLKALNAYIDDESIVQMYREFGAHLAGCRACQVVVDNIRKTIRLYSAGEPYPMPEGFEDRFRAALRARWKVKFPNAQV